MKIHFIAIGGSAMHNLAIALQEKGYEISGSDDHIYDPSYSRLEEEGLLPERMGWFPDKITTDLDAIIVGMHAKPDNPELLQAKHLELKLYSYPEFLYEQSKDKTRVVIAGSHGKTTITSMILHVLHHHNQEVDFMIGAQIDGFKTMVHLTDRNDFILLEGDEYLSSPIDDRPKFLHYQPHIALISGISWDHINVFPTYETYVHQFERFTEVMQSGSILVYNADDSEVKRIAEKATKPTRKHPYAIPAHEITDGVTYLQTPEGDMPLEIFGKHNLSNLAGAKWICQHMGIDEDEFYEAIAEFKGADKRLEKVGESDETIIFRDFAHAPSKVRATVRAVKNQYHNHKLFACLELHTYSSLNPNFLKQYEDALQAADKAVVYYNPEAVKLKRLSPITREQILTAFNRSDLIIKTDPTEFKDWLFEQDLSGQALLMMSSGNYGGLDFEELKELL